jgi:methylated-DNA-[protein]-cysteine S-methyltransferase
MIAYETLETPLGRFTIVVAGDGAVIAAAFGELDDIRHLIGPGEVLADDALTAEARRQVEEYFAGTRREFDLKLAAPGTDFQRRYREEMESLLYGTTTSYGALANKLGSSARATGRANATNPLCIIVPCHRVIGADGSLTGYAYGVDIKRRLLEHEGALVQQALPV